MNFPLASNIIKLCSALDNPQKTWPSIHIAGTNGKGTVTHMIAAGLQAAGLKVGIYSSPHYIDFRERIKEIIVKKSFLNLIIIIRLVCCGIIPQHTSLSRDL